MRLKTVNYHSLERIAACMQHPCRAFLLRGNKYDFDIVFHGSHLAVFPDLQLCFNRIKKSGNTTVSAFLSDLSNRFTTESKHGFKKILVKPKSMSLAQLELLPSFYSLVVVRNPYSRALSAFLEKVAPGRSSKYHYCAGFGNSTSDGFYEFLTFLDNGGLWRDRHFWPQVNLLYQPIENFSRVARLEQLVDDMRIVLSDIGQDPMHAEVLARPHQVEAGKSKITSASTKLSEFYTAGSAALVRKLYAQDFQRFRYPTHLSNHFPSASGLDEKTA
ncbi:hypothetical protein C2I36_09505 [Rhodobacteraceae bacterium WD3A24]|nr:hypothetical protein C2I36_09505 [Rhodobacteraceae bacterium WD3A24]